MDFKKTNRISELGNSGAITRRAFLTYSAGAFGALTLNSLAWGDVGAAPRQYRNTAIPD